ncbi:Peptidoglycan glycosyltransferase MrdB [Vibrio chagasii]|uniref:rod shape-determining protein RodA n=1 Tax=Vibrio fortis TaxID=212667 RepID=UPI00336D29FD|nr:Peptidoglycan glycosyltransferase MrdB [Vibrio chagasii]CAH7350569.1 Peptidoglycan glycosyltransferase MrdB [Vibrio chagasii]
MKISSSKNRFIDLSLDKGLGVDGWLFSIILALLSFSVIVVFSASGQNTDLVRVHVIKGIIALGMFCVMSRINPSYIKQLSVKLYVLSVFLLLLVDFFGEIRMGAQRWLDLGFMSFQPSELAKLTVPLICAYALSHMGLVSKVRHVCVYLALVAVPCVLILGQPDLGTSIMVAFSGLVVVFFAGVPWMFILAAAGAMLLCAPVIWCYVLREYQRERILTVLNPEADPLGAGYHVIQSKAAIGAGGQSGVGWLEGTQTHLGFIPEQHTDFIFAVIGEELGFTGFLMLICLYMLLIGRMFYIMMKSESSYAKAYIGAIACVVFAYVFVNLGMVTGILPVVGVPLPLVSFGGTATMTLLVSLGIVSAYSVRDTKT